MAVEHRSVAAVPETILTCDDYPAIPDPDKATQGDVAAFIPQTYASWESCFGNLATVRGLIHKQQSESTP